jgi:hypothetical protein
MFKIKKQIIEFTNVNNWPEDTAPVAALKVVPEWYKKTPSWHDQRRINSGDMTIKKCMPVFDALSAGYILLTPCDLIIKQENGEPSYHPSMLHIMEGHASRQAHLHPSASKDTSRFPKWINSWAIKTPKGYSSLFLNPIHNSNPWFAIFEGLVDTDTYHVPVNIPFVLKDPTFQGLIPAGTPLVQIIPFKRDVWTPSFGKEEEKKESIEQHKLLERYAWDRYKRLFRQKKEWNNHS